MPEPDICDALDQVCVIRVHDDRIHLPSYLGVAAALRPMEQSGTWSPPHPDVGGAARAYPSHG
ncbi:hypothetical protein ABZT04_07630 [Streptomyces sp. NPDC005492]|uniref:hypothetical protein n=1 Tax=Streptomyces sp. NPDC005492 TaxID=3156883 RepID=UPI00339FE8D5